VTPVWVLLGVLCTPQWTDCKIVDMGPDKWFGVGQYDECEAVADSVKQHEGMIAACVEQPEV
jgi:hypothetical protein